MRRREFITLLGGAAATAPLAARAQQPAMPLVGYLSIGSSEALAHLVVQFREGLSQAGYVEGRNVAIEFGWSGPQFGPLAALAADLVRRQATVFYARSLPAVHAAKMATSTIPIVFSMGEDSVKEGIVARLSRPDGNVTGFTDFSNQLAGKRLGLLRDIAPATTALGLLVNPTNPNAGPDTLDAQLAAAALGRELKVFTASAENDLATVFDTMVEMRVGALFVNIDPYFLAHREQLVALASRYRLPVLFDRRDYVLAGGLMSYGTDLRDVYRQAGIYVGRILKGSKPSELPVQQATKFDFVINLRAAKALGLTIPEGLVIAADEVIE
jgi:putative tryptophan/tyrosine transport system substrate-binding protein